MNGSRPGLKPILAHFYRWESETPHAQFLRQPYGDDWVTLSYAEADAIARRLNLLLALPVIGTLVRAKIRKAMGLDAAEVFLTGTAPTSESLKAWFQKLGINLREVYGMTETSGAITVMPWDDYQPGSVGKAVSSVELRIDPENEKLWVKMPWSMAGYFEATALSATVLQDGWLRTGDKARIDEHGFVYIIGRVKDSFKTSKGKFVVPGPIEAGLAQNSILEQVCVVGSGLPQPLALVVLSEYGKSVVREKVEEKLLRDLALVNAASGNHARLSCVVLMQEEWSVDNDILTPTLKVRRSQIEDKFAAWYTNWQQKKQQIIWESETRRTRTISKTSFPNRPRKFIGCGEKMPKFERENCERLPHCSIQQDRGNPGNHCPAAASARIVHYE